MKIFEQREIKPISEMTLTNSKTQSKKGQKGFGKSLEPKSVTITIAVTPTVKAFINEYCSLNKIQQTALFMAGLECYTRFNGTNHEEIIADLKEMLEDTSHYNC
jgi:hypothetical protein